LLVTSETYYGNVSILALPTVILLNRAVTIRPETEQWFRGHSFHRLAKQPKPKNSCPRSPRQTSCIMYAQHPQMASSSGTPTEIYILCYVDY